MDDGIDLVHLALVAATCSGTGGNAAGTSPAASSHKLVQFVVQFRV